MDEKGRPADRPGTRRRLGLWSPPEKYKYAYSSERDSAPARDIWGLSDLWEVTDTHFRRPGEGLDEALGRWILFLLRNAVKAYLRFLTIILVCAILGAIIVTVTR